MYHMGFSIATFLFKRRSICVYALHELSHFAIFQAKVRNNKFIFLQFLRTPIAASINSTQYDLVNLCSEKHFDSDKNPWVS